MGANYAFYVKTIETHACAFLALNILAIGRVSSNAARCVALPAGGTFYSAKKAPGPPPALKPLKNLL